jgi:hypothetical protein
MEMPLLFEAAFSLLSVRFYDQHDEDGKDAHRQVKGQLKS